MEQAPDPAIAYVPGAHGFNDGFVVPAGHATPAGHWPVHCGDEEPALNPYTPAGHGVQPAAPARLNVPTGQTVAVMPSLQDEPAGHGTAVALEEPCGHKKPAAQPPTQADVVAPCTLLYRPVKAQKVKTVLSWASLDYEEPTPVDNTACVVGELHKNDSTQ